MTFKLLVQDREKTFNFLVISLNGILNLKAKSVRICSIMIDSLVEDDNTSLKNDIIPSQGHI
jgi:hypothetical protein